MRTGTMLPAGIVIVRTTGFGGAGGRSVLAGTGGGLGIACCTGCTCCTGGGGGGAVASATCLGGASFRAETRAVRGCGAVAVFGGGAAAAFAGCTVKLLLTFLTPFTLAASFAARARDA